MSHQLFIRPLWKGTHGATKLFNKYGTYGTHKSDLCYEVASTESVTGVRKQQVQRAWLVLRSSKYRERDWCYETESVTGVTKQRVQRAWLVLGSSEYRERDWCYEAASTESMTGVTKQQVQKKWLVLSNVSHTHLFIDTEEVRIV